MVMSRGTVAAVVSGSGWILHSWSLSQRRLGQRGQPRGRKDDNSGHSYPEAKASITSKRYSVLPAALSIGG